MRKVKLLKPFLLFSSFVLKLVNILSQFDWERIDVHGQTGDKDLVLMLN